MDPVAECAPLDDEDRTRCEIWTRVMGYHRPISSWNPGKRQEYEDRVVFRQPSLDEPAERGRFDRDFKPEPLKWDYKQIDLSIRDD